MKVGTDGVLLGAWSPLPQGPIRVLDIGTGTGLIALMLAQRFPEAQLVGIEPDAAAFEEAQSNVAQSPWADRIQLEQADLKTYAALQPRHSFDVLVSNPPFYTHNHHDLNQARNQARSAQALPLEALLSTAQQLLRPEGWLFVILPAEQEAAVRHIINPLGGHCWQCVQVKGQPHSPIKRQLWGIRWRPCEAPESSTLVLELARHQRSPEYQRLTQDFYLKPV